MNDGVDPSRFERVRRDHQTEVAEDYVELILEEIERDGRAQLTELAKALGVAHPTVAKALRRLEAEDYVVVQPYRGVELTEKGRRLAEDCRRRHALVVAFLRHLGVSAEVAEHDAEGIEHHLSPETLEAMRAAVETGGPSGS